MSTAKNNQYRTLGSQERFDKEAIAATQHAVALRGATLAFGNGKKKPEVKPKPETYVGIDGALAAAAGAGSRAIRERREVSSFDGNRHGEVAGVEISGRETSGRNTYTQPSGKGEGEGVGPPGNGLLRPGEQRRSASYIAANLAASRSPSISPNVTGQSRQYTNIVGWEGTKREVSPLKYSGSERSGQSEERTLDQSPIPPTTSLINMFEKNKGRDRSGGRNERLEDAVVAAQVSKKNGQREMTGTRVKTRSSSPPMKATKPETTRGISKGTFTKIRAQTPPPRSRVLEPATRITSKAITTKPAVPSSTLSKSPKPEVTRRFSPDTQSPSTSSGRASTPGQTNRVPKPIAPASKPIPIPRPQRAPISHEEDEYASSDDSFVSASDHRPSFRAEIQNQRRANINPTSKLSVKSSVTVDSLANAIVASSLASSRAVSPSHTLRVPAPPLSRRSPRSPRSHRLFHHSEPSRSASPAKPIGLRTTMRKPKMEEEVDEGAKRRLKKAHLMKKHPNKHHEGDRKRWRDEVTERERKRYEAVWASNKGLHLASIPGAETSVCSLVVRDIWSRSKLHFDVLEEAYSLVDREKNGMLEKEEFVVGLWLVDQRLKGRKLPIRVSESVWRSVGSLRGFNWKDVNGKEKKNK